MLPVHGIFTNTQTFAIMRKTLSGGGILLAAISLMLAGCDSGSDPMPSVPTAPNVSLLEANAQGNDALDALAEATAAALADPALRAELRNEARKKFDGDYDVLFHPFKSRDVGGRSVETRLNEGLQARRAGLAETANSLAADVPNLNFYVFGAEGWKSNSQAPLVAYAPMGVDDLEVQSLKAYDAEGNVHWLDAKADPTQPVVVLGINERTDAMGNVTFGANRQATSSKLPEVPSYVPPQECDPVEDPDCDTGGGGGGGTGGGTTPTYRQLPSHTEKLVWINVLDDNEPWFKGNCELKWIYSAANVPNGVVYSDYNENAVEDITFYPNATAFTWNPSTNGGFYAVHWVEEDWGVTFSFGISIKGKLGWPTASTEVTVPFTFSIKDEDDDMGTRGINYDEPLGTYSLSDVEWKVG